MKKCPVCKVNLNETTVEAVTLDVCSNGCGGIWFDMFELKKVDEPHEILNEEVLKLDTRSSSDDSVESFDIRHCPCCPDEALIRRSYDIFDQVEVDQCTKCSGIWLDNGELEIIRSQFKTEKERLETSDKFLNNEFENVKSSMSERISYYEELAAQNKKSNALSLSIMKKLNAFLK